MESPEKSPTNTAAPAKGSRFAQKAGKWIGVIGIVVFAMIWLGRKDLMGKRYKASDLESVNYSEQATEEDAKKLGAILKENGFFDGKRKVDVLLRKDAKEGTVVSFIISGIGKDEKVADAFRAIGEDIAAKGFGKPLIIRLRDTKLNTLRDIKLEKTLAGPSDSGGPVSEAQLGVKIYPGARIVTSGETSEVVSANLETSDAAAKVIAFYEEELGAPKGSSSMVKAQKNGRTFVVSVAASGTKTAVSIMVKK